MNFFQLPPEIRLAVYQSFCNPEGDAQDTTFAESKTVVLSAPRSLGLRLSPLKTKPVIKVAIPNETSSRNHGAVLLVCRQMYAEIVDLYWASYSVRIDSPLKSIPSALDRIPKALCASLKTLTLPHRLIRHVDPTAKRHTTEWNEACMSLSQTLPRLERLNVQLSGDLGTLALQPGRINFFKPLLFDNELVAAGQTKRPLRSLSLEWTGSGWEEEAEQTATVLAERGAVVTVESMTDGLTRRTYTFTALDKSAWRAIEVEMAQVVVVEEDKGDQLCVGRANEALALVAALPEDSASPWA